MKNIIVSGATSFIGVQLIQQLLDGHYHVLALVRPNSVHMKRLMVHPNLKILELDIVQIKELSKHITQPYDTFYHLAWEGARSPENNNADLQHQNYLNSINAILTAKQCGCSCFIGIGSQAEYGLVKGYVDETHPTQPYTEYGKAKLRVYQEGQVLSQSLGLRWIWARIFSGYGPYDHPAALINFCLTKMLKNEDIPLSQCSQYWDFMHVEDIGRILKLLGESKSCMGVYNIANGDARPLKDFIDEMQVITNSTSNLQFGMVPYGPLGPVSLRPITLRIQTECGFKPKIDFETGIHRLIKAIKEQV